MLPERAHSNVLTRVEALFDSVYDDGPRVIHIATVESKGEVELERHCVAIQRVRGLEQSPARYIQLHV